MNKKSLISFLFITVSVFANAQTDTIKFYSKKTYMIPMRDGVKLFTLILSPKNDTKPLPFLLWGTPYGVNFPIPDSGLSVEDMGEDKLMAKEGYYIVGQEIRGKFKSEGTFEMCRPLYHLTDETKTDESTDAWDTVDWLIKNIKNNNGKAGIRGVSYPGYMAFLTKKTITISLRKLIRFVKWWLC